MSPSEGYWGGYAIHDPVYLEEQEKEECRSGDEFEAYQDYTGPAVLCGVKCWTGKWCRVFDGKTPGDGWTWVRDNVKDWEILPQRPQTRIGRVEMLMSMASMPLTI
jgi:hypothetical protein